MSSQDSPSTTSPTANFSNSSPTANFSNSSPTATRRSKEEIISAIKSCAAKLGHIPSQAEMQREKGISRRSFARQFGNYTKALRACGFDGQGSGFMLSMEELF